MRIPVAHRMLSTPRRSRRRLDISSPANNNARSSHIRDIVSSSCKDTYIMVICLVNARSFAGGGAKARCVGVRIVVGLIVTPAVIACSRRQWLAPPLRAVWPPLPTYYPCLPLRHARTSSFSLYILLIASRHESPPLMRARAALRIVQR